MILRYLCSSSSPAKSSGRSTRRGTMAAAYSQMQCKRRILIAPTTASCYFSTTSVVLDNKEEYKTPASVLEWEKVAAKELSRSKKLNVDYLRTQRLTAEGIAMQPVYFDLQNNATNNPDMPGVYPYTRGPYAVRVSTYTV
jgi:hypothetical protein